MKEYLSSLEPEEYNKVYIQTVMGHMVGQYTLEGDTLLYANPEKYPPTKGHDLKPNEPEIIRRQGVQAALHPFSTYGKHRNI